MRVFRISFLNQGKIYEIYAKRVQQGELYGFVEVHGLLFDDANKLLVDPSTERLKTEFEGVNRTIIPIHSVIRIDEVAKEGQGKIREVGDKNNITPFPSPLYSPRPDSDT
jgi:hypothetical protein